MSMGSGGGLFGSGGGLFGGGGMANPRGAFGPWAGCGCSSIFIILAGVLLVFGGCLRMVGQ
jgi:hypothetical protein